MNDSMMFKYLIGKYCFRGWILFLLIVFLGIDLIISPILTLGICVNLFLGLRIYVGLSQKGLSGILGWALSGVYFVFLIEIILPVVALCESLRLL